jgi:prepilin-type N-terminal cleavage/methylation domain-containing protein/prepilin-type processing-associated H-X9-DG protein
MNTNRHELNRGGWGLAFAAFTLIELLVVIAVIAILAGLTLPVIGLGLRKAKSVQCVSNLRQLGIGIRLYANDHAGRLPVAAPFRNASSNAYETLPLIQTVLADVSGPKSKLFKCPEDRRGLFERDGSSFEWNASINGRMLSRMGQDGSGQPPSATFLLRDREGFHARGSKNALYADGHARAQKHQP